MADARARNQLQHGVEHAEPRTQDRDHDDVGCNPLPLGDGERGLDLGRLRRQRPQRLRGEQDADPHRHAAEFVGGGALVAQ